MYGLPGQNLCSSQLLQIPHHTHSTVLKPSPCHSCCCSQTYVQVAGQSARVFEHSTRFSSLLGQLLGLSAEDPATQATITRLHAIQQTALKVRAEKEAADAAKLTAKLSQADKALKEAMAA